MKILFDEDVPHPLMRVLPDYDIRTVAGMGWRGVKNGELLKYIEAELFDVFVTGDKNLQNQQNLSRRPFAVLVLSAISWPIIQENITIVAKAIETAQPGSVNRVECGAFLPRRNS